MKKNGFTLIELIVGVAVFGITMGIILGIFVSTIRLQRYSLSLQQLLSQTSYAMEYMGRLIRMAKKELDSSPPPSCISLGFNYKDNIDVDVAGHTKTMKILFRDYKQRCKGFFLENGKLNEYEKNRSPKETLPLTSDDFEVTKFDIALSGEEQTDNYQPKVTVLLEAIGQNITPQPKIIIQTTISQRDLDVKE